MIGSIAFYIFMEFILSLTIFSIILTANNNMHSCMSENVLRAKIFFFDSNPIGRILTRFSKDIVTLDLIIPSIISLFTYGLFRIISVIILIIVISPFLIIPLVFAAIYLKCVLDKAKIPMIEA